MTAKVYKGLFLRGLNEFFSRKGATAQRRTQRGSLIPESLGVFLCAVAPLREKSS
jgi:hypothetical protein